MSDKNNTSIFGLLKNLNVSGIMKLARKVDLGKLISKVNQMSESDLNKMMKMLDKGPADREPPPIEGDFYDLSAKLSPEEREIQLKVRDFMETHVEPIANEYWQKAEFPMHLIPKMGELGICGLTLDGYGCPNKSNVLQGFLAQEMARIDPSFSTFFGVQSGLAMGSIYECGSEEQKQKWLPEMHKMNVIGAFGLTEPKVGSAVAGGLTTKAKRKGDTWVLNGQKKWIGNATFSDITIVWAEDVDSGDTKGFIVEKDNPGFKAEKMEDKMALRTVQNALITLEDCEVKEANRLQNANTFKDTSRILKLTRASVAWQAVGCARGAYENALAYCNERKQFGKTIGSFQLVQDLLVEMLTNLTAMQSMVYRLSELQDEGKLTDERASLAKVVCTLKTREIVSKARELLGGNGILLRYNVARFVADSEAIYSYEGTKEINSLIVGRAITGKSAFV